ncbi:MAG: alpha/beta hydrolase fold protein [Myxococcaceae bacterium]|nr:alpha/beta hydrolase fold protein [Myxococcaceae bacterium]
MSRLSLFVFLLLTVACHPPKTASGGPPAPGPIPSSSCDGKAPVDPAIAHVPGVRASWFNDPSGRERLYVLEAGPPERHAREPPLVLIHGVGAIGTADYYPALAQLSRKRHVLAIDLPGFGRSNPEDQDFGPERLARSVDVVVRACAPGKIDLLGHSSGGSLALLFAAKRADVVRRLVLADVAGILRPEVLLHGQLHQTLTPMHDHVPHLANAVEKTGGVLVDALHALVPNAKDVAESGVVGHSPGVLAASALLDFNFGPAISEVRAPTLILWGKEDFVVPTRIERLLHSRLARSEVIFIADSGHVPMKDQPERMATLVNEYLDGAELKEPEVAVPLAKELHDGSCNDQDDLTLTGDFDKVIVSRCKRVHLNKVRARQIMIRKSDGHLDDCQVSDSLAVYDSDLFITGSELRGTVALDVSESELDIAGVVISGSEAAVRVHQKSHIVLSVTKVHSPKTDSFMHVALDLKEDEL